MAPTESPRDHSADADPTISRKKQRLSDDEHQSPHSEPDSPVVELVASDPSDANNMEGIEIENEVVESYATGFAPFNNLPPGPLQVDGVRRHCEDNYIDARMIYYLNTWVQEHLNDTANHDQETWLENYTKEEAFFGTLAVSLYLFFERSDAFYRAGNHKLQDVTIALIQNFELLSVRIIRLLPLITNDRVSRRDSTQSSNEQQEIPLLNFISLLSPWVCGTAPALMVLCKELDMTLEPFHDVCAQSFRDDEQSLEALAAVFHNLAKNHRSIQHSWLVMNHILMIMSHFSTSQGELVDDVLEEITKNVLPVLCEKHPRALPDNFHNLVVYVGSVLLLRRASELDIESCTSLFYRFVQSEEDALLPHSADESDSQALRQLSRDDPGILAELLQTAWILQTQKSFISSDIIDVRNCGVTLLSATLLGMYKRHHARHFAFVEHPVTQYASRFLRANEVTKYIFSPDSHASLINHCDNIVSFLAVTESYTDQETEIIWQACITSVEAEFVNASINVLRRICQYLNFEQLRHIIGLYVATPMSKLSANSISFLPELFRMLHDAKPSRGPDSNNLVAPSLAVDILKHIDAEEHQPISEVVRRMAVTEISKGIEMTAEERFQIYQNCIGDIKDRNSQATNSMEVLKIFLQRGMTKNESRKLLSILPLGQAVAEIGHFVEQAAKQPNDENRKPIKNGIVTRLETVVLMLGLPHQMDNDDAKNELFDNVFGTSSLDDLTRHHAWMGLWTMARSENGPEAAKPLLKSYMETRVPDLPGQYAPYSLVEGISAEVRNCTRNDAKQTSQLLMSPLWKTLVRFATESPRQMTSNLANKQICEILFAEPGDNEVKMARIQCQSQFVLHYVNEICDIFTNCEPESAAVARIFRSMNLLLTICKKSRETEPVFRGPKQGKDLVLGLVDDESDVMYFSLEIYTTTQQNDTVSVKAAPSITVAELAKALPELTSMAESKIIVGGKPIDLSTDGPKTLSEIGIISSGVILICPRFIFGCDMNKFLTFPGPAEQAIVSQYDRLKDLVDGPYDVACPTYELLRMLSPSNAMRSLVSSPDVSTAELLPPEKPFRILLSLSVLLRHLSDLAGLAVADENFIMGVIRRLTDFVVEQEQQSGLEELTRVLDCLFAFLNERPTPSPERTYFDRPELISGRLATHLCNTQQMPPSHPRNRLILAACRVLLRAGSVDTKVWISFAGDPRVARLQASLLLDEDAWLSHTLSEMITTHCRERLIPQVMVESFWDVMEPSLSMALEHSQQSTPYFRVYQELLKVHGTIQSSEELTRSLLQRLISILWEYTHTETPDSPVFDPVMRGILEALVITTRTLKSFKKPLELDGVPSKLFEKLLFPPLDLASSRPLMHTETRKLVFTLIQEACTSNEDYRNLSVFSNEAMGALPDNSSSDFYFPGPDKWIRPSDHCTGLTNLGMTCYMNSLLQQFYANLPFRDFIFKVPIVNPDRQVLLQQVKWLFSAMQNDTLSVINTSDLARILQIRIESQEDVHGFYATFMSKLEDDIPDAEAKKQLTSFFTGKFISQIKGSCGHTSTQTEPFMDVSITVKNKTGLQESLEEFVQGEPMQGSNRYRCSTCDPDNGGCLVDAMKRTCLDEVPDNLVFCLKRFTLESMMGLEGKVNDFFGFPAEIDMSRYQRSFLEDSSSNEDQFELVGVIVHKGTLEFGHYWSYVRLGGEPATWVRLEDNLATNLHDGINVVQENCFGGHTPNGIDRPDSAYVLFYQRKKSIEDEKALIHLSSGMTSMPQGHPPRVRVPHEMRDVIAKRNSARYRVAHLFSASFSNFMEWMVHHYPDVPGDEDSSQGSMSDDSQPNEFVTMKDLLGELLANYLLRVALRDLSDGFKCKSLLTGMGSTFKAHPSAVPPFLNHLVADERTFGNIWRYEHAGSRTKCMEFLGNCITLIRENNAEDYETTLRRLTKAHSAMTEHDLVNYSPHWADYYGFAAQIAELGPLETAAVLDTGLLASVLYFLCVGGTAKYDERPLIWTAIRQGKADIDPLYEFIHSILSGYVNFASGTDEFSYQKYHQVVNGQVSLLETEMHILTLKTEVGKGAPMWTLGRVGLKHCHFQSGWQSFPIGKLMALLSSPDSNLALVALVRDALLTGFHEEQDRFLPLTYATLHVCASRGNSPDAQSLLHEMVKFALEWEDPVSDLLHVLATAYKFTPAGVYKAMQDTVWYLRFLTGTSRDSRDRTEHFLNACLLVAPSETFDEDDVDRVHLIRAVVRRGINILHDAFNKDEGRARFEQLIQTMIETNTCLAAHIDALKVYLDDLPAKTTNRVVNKAQTELDEATTSLASLRSVLDEIEHWDDGVSIMEPDASPLHRSFDGISEGFESTSEDDERE